MKVVITGAIGLKSHSVPADNRNGDTHLQHADIRDTEPAGAPHECRYLIGSNGHEQFVVIAAAEDQIGNAAVARQRRACRCRKRQRLKLQLKPQRS